MSDVKQIGVVGNAIHISQLPEANAFTYGEGNRFYTLENAQDGYISGHTYRTLLSDGVYSWIDVDDYGATDTEGTAIVNFLAGSYSGAVVDKYGLISTIYALDFCKKQNITGVYLPNVAAIGASSKNNSTETDTGNAFAVCYKLKTLYTPKCSQIIGERNFYMCSTLESVNMPEYTSTIPSMTFYGCSKMTYANLGTTKTVYCSAFERCSSLSVLECGGIGYTSSRAFSYCTALESISFNSYSVYLSAETFYNCGLRSIYMSCESSVQFAPSVFAFCFSLGTVDITAPSVFTHYQGLFRNCSKLSNVRIVCDNTISFYSSAFLSCISFKWGDLKSAKILAINGRDVFSACISLDCLELPYATLLSGNSMFKSCGKLSYIYAPVIKTVSLNSTALYQCYSFASFYLMQESGLSEADVPFLLAYTAFSYNAIGTYTADRHPWIYVGYSEYLPWIQAATNWVNISSYILVSQFSST